MENAIEQYSEDKTNCSGTKQHEGRNTVGLHARWRMRRARDKRMNYIRKISVPRRQSTDGSVQPLQRFLHLVRTPTCAAVNLHPARTDREHNAAMLGLPTSEMMAVIVVIMYGGFTFRRGKIFRFFFGRSSAGYAFAAQAILQLTQALTL